MRFFYPLALTSQGNTKRPILLGIGSQQKNPIGFGQQMPIFVSIN
jgi:hypothetical protein